MNSNVSRSDWSSTELMVCLSARELEDGSSVVVGTGLPCAAAALAQRTHAKDLLIIFEAGGVGARMPTMPISVGDSRTFFQGIMASSMPEVIEMCQRGLVDYAFLGGAQIDMYGNLNSTLIGQYVRPRVRFPGSGGANDLASLCWRTIVMMPQDRRRFVESVDFVTSPGYLSGKGARESVGLPADTGPLKVITNLSVLGFCPETGRMKVESLHPGVSREQVQENTGFTLIWPEKVPASEPPSSNELELLRSEIDPFGYVLGRS